MLLRRSGRRLVGRCPFHDDRDPSFVVYTDSQSYFCFGCNAGGDVIDFVARLHRLDFKEAAAHLSGSLPPSPVSLPARREREPRVLRGQEPDVLETAVSLYERQLRRHRSGQKYLKARGIDRRTTAELRVGYASGGLERELRRAKLDRRVAEELGLLSGSRDTLAERITIPDLDAGGRPTWLTGRALITGATPRYFNAQLPSPLLGLAAVAGRRAAIVLTEGPFDWLTLRSWGLRGVALNGTHVPHDALVTLGCFQRVYLALDTDGAGRRAAVGLVAQLRDRAVIVPLPAGVHDLNELGQRRDGRDAFLRSLHAARERLDDSWQSQTEHDRRSRAA